MYCIYVYIWLPIYIIMYIYILFQIVPNSSRSTRRVWTSWRSAPSTGMPFDRKSPVQWENHRPEWRGCFLYIIYMYIYISTHVRISLWFFMYFPCLMTRDDNGWHMMIEKKKYLDSRQVQMSGLWRKALKVVMFAPSVMIPSIQAPALSAATNPASFLPLIQIGHRSDGVRKVLDKRLQECQKMKQVQ